MSVSSNIFSLRNLGVLITTIVLLGLFRLSLIAQINDSIQQLRIQPSIITESTNDVVNKQTDLKHISDEIGQIKTLIDEDRKIVQSIAKDLPVELSEGSPKSNNLPDSEDIKHIVNQAIKGQLNVIKQDIIGDVMNKPSQNKVHGIFRQNEEVMPGSSGPFQKYESYRLIWFCTVRNNYIDAKPPADMGGAGFAAEAIDFIIPLCKKYPFFGWVEEAETAKWKQSFLFQGLPTYEQELIEKCNERGKELMEMDNIPGIGIMEYMPSAFARIKDKAANKAHIGRMKYVIGRSMFETNNLPPGWADLINKNVNEMWVPTQFHVNVFTSHGVNVRVKAIGEGFDPVRFDSSIVPESRAALFPECNIDDFIFLAASEYIDRKGFDHVFEAYATAFTSEDKVCIAVRASGLESFTFDNPNNLRRDKVGKLTNDEYTQFYKSGNAFVSGSHGEGWGRTNQEAMAMGLPVIVPVWGGVTGYVREDVIISVKVDGLEQAFPDKPDTWMLGKDKPNHQWAEVQMPRIRTAMQWAYNNQEAAREIGEKAKVYMKEYFTRAKIADDVLERTDKIFKQFNE